MLTPADLDHPRREVDAGISNAVEAGGDVGAEVAKAAADLEHALPGERRDGGERGVADLERPRRRRVDGAGTIAVAIDERVVVAGNPYRVGQGHRPSTTSANISQTRSC